MTSDEVYKLIEDNGLTLHGDIEHFAALIEQRTWVGLTEEEIEHCMKQAYATVQGRQLERAFAQAIEAKLKDKNTPQRTEQNFCQRCGKRTKDLTHIHTCTPPQEKNT
jgi:hypothetical protein